jgi:hypothetical protein
MTHCVEQLSRRFRHRWEPHTRRVNRNQMLFARFQPLPRCSLGHGGSFSAHLVAFSHLQLSQIRGRQPHLFVRKILYVIRYRARHGFKRKHEAWRAGDERLERPLCLCLHHPLFVFNQFGDLERAYNLGNFLHMLATPEPIKDWSLTSLKEKLIKIGAKVVSHRRYVVFQMAQVAIPRQMFQEILRLIAELRPQPPPAPA